MQKCIKKLKRNKSHGIDCLLNEYFIESGDMLSLYICNIFNAILASGVFPNRWTQGIIIPLFKKGDHRVVENYRGITLLSCFSKLFTTLLNDRISSFCNKYNLISDEQFGFRKGVSTTDAICSLLSVVQHFLNNNKRLYVAFIDLKKCFDSIYRNALWYKLFNADTRGRVLRIVKNMYMNVKSCVKHCNSFSDFFEYSVGLRQGDVISPLLVSLFLEDLELYLQNNANSGIEIYDIVLLILLFADDMVILGNTPEELQSHLNCLANYCQNWSLEVNSSKTKIMVFRKRGVLRADEQWFYKTEAIQVVENFNYLGCIFKYNGVFSANSDFIVGKSLKALNNLLFNFKKLPLTPKSYCELFDAFVGSTLNYESEVWGFSKFKNSERVHLKFCKSILNVRKSTASVGVYGELGRYPLYISKYKRIISYWCKLLRSENVVIASLYRRALEDCNLGNTNWVSSVKKLLDDYGFSNVFLYPQSISINFPNIFHQRVVDNFIQEWYGLLQSSSILTDYVHYKNTFSYETYLDVLPVKLRKYITQFRIGAHSLRIHTGRYGSNNIPRNERYCLYCGNQDLEDVYHFICICPCYSSVRQKFLNSRFYVRPSVFKFNSLMGTHDSGVLKNIANYIKSSLEIRQSISVS